MRRIDGAKDCSNGARPSGKGRNTSRPAQTRTPAAEAAMPAQNRASTAVNNMESRQSVARGSVEEELMATHASERLTQALLETISH